MVKIKKINKYLFKIVKSFICFTIYNEAKTPYIIDPSEVITIISERYINQEF